MNSFFKSYEVVSIIPVYEMKKEDWDLLDWGLLRNTAKNRIAKSINKDFLGFAKVHVFTKGIAKPNYLWPVSIQMAQEIARTGSIPFRNEVEVESLTKAARMLDNGVDGIEALILFYGAALVLKYATDQADEEDLHDEMLALAESDFEDYDGLSQALAIALELVKYKGFEWLQSFIDAADEALGRADDAGLT